MYWLVTIAGFLAYKTNTEISRTTVKHIYYVQFLTHFTASYHSAVLLAQQTHTEVASTTFNKTFLTYFTNNIILAHMKPQCFSHNKHIKI